MLFRSGKLEESGEKTEKFWSSTLGPLTFLTEHEAQLKARASTIEEYQKLNQPSYTIINLACLPEGLAIWSLANNVRPEGGYRYERGDDDGDMWKDDCMEFFFALPNGKLCRLLYNSAGAKTFIYDGRIVPAADIRSYYKSPVNGSGGTSNKLLIPWRYFGLKQTPAPGTVWEFNVGREFHSHQAILSWARVGKSFHERDKWGRLVFAGGSQVELTALEYSPEGSTIFIDSGENPIYRWISITDSGAGMENVQCARIFKRFEYSKSEKGHGDLTFRRRDTFRSLGRSGGSV